MVVGLAPVLVFPLALLVLLVQVLVLVQVLALAQVFPPQTQTQVRVIQAFFLRMYRS